MRDDSDTLTAFNDTKNDAALFVGWWDYYAVTKMLPLPAQVFQMWWYALNAGKLAPATDRVEIRGASLIPCPTTSQLSRSVIVGQVARVKGNAGKKNGSIYAGSRKLVGRQVGLVAISRDAGSFHIRKRCGTVCLL